jgi:hypothetical protein
MPLINRAAVKRAALSLAYNKYKERNQTRKDMGLTPLKQSPSRVSGSFLDRIEGKVLMCISSLVEEHKTGLTL